MRVCFISFEYPPNILGGAGTYAETLVKGLRRRGIDVFVISRGNEHNEYRRTFRVPTSNSIYWRRLFFMEPAITLFHRLNDRYKFDLVHFNEPHIILEKPNLPTVCTLHSAQVNEIKLRLSYPRTVETATDIKDFAIKSPIGSIFDILTANIVDRIICPSHHLATLIKSYCFANEQKISVIPNGIDLEAFDKIRDYNATEFLRKYNLETDSYILFMGRLTVLKGAQYLINAFRSISKDYPSLKLAIVGAGYFENRLKNLTPKTKNVVFTGHVNSLEDKKALYKNSLFVIVPSLYEALPIVVLEAMACSKAVIASNVGGIPMLVHHGENGFLAPPGDIKSLEKFIKILIEDQVTRRNMGAFGRKLTERTFTTNEMASKTLKVYESLLDA
jgi:glycosyltransferase involved in cell wall biosynthesis